MLQTKKKLRSMTAYGRATATDALGHFTIELYSVNRRHLEIINSFPSELLCYDAKFKRWIGAAIGRGHITVKLSATFVKATPTLVKPNLPLARQLKEAWDQIAADLNLPAEQSFNLAMLNEVEGIILYENNDTLHEELSHILHKCVDEALADLIAMKEAEGTALNNDITERLKMISQAVDQISTYAPDAVQRFQLELKRRLEEILPGKVENEERLLREVCLYAERVDIVEELIRLKSHLEQFAALLDSPNGAIGKKLEFFVQEMNREINTIGSKASDLKISQLVIDVKGELERIREQIQNVE